MSKFLGITAGFCAILVLAFFFAKYISKTHPTVYSQTQGATAALALHSVVSPVTPAINPLAIAATKVAQVVTPLKQNISNPRPLVVPSTAPANPFVQAPAPITPPPPISFGYQYTVPPGGGQGDTSVQLVASVPVVVLDTTPPVITASSNISAEATSSLGAYVAYTLPSANDAISGPAAVSCTPISNTRFALGTTTVVCSASDASSNVASSTFKVVVVDTTTPTIASTSNITVEATSSLGAYVTYTAPTSTDTVSGSLATSCTASSSSLFALGTSTVVCSATDTAGNIATSSFNIFVVDTTAPVIASTTDLFVIATSSNSTFATVTYTAPTTTDLVSGSGTATCTPASGSLFAVGSTTVTCTATDAAGNTATSTFAAGVSVPAAPAGPTPGTPFTFAASQIDESYLCNTDLVNGFGGCFQGTSTAPLHTQTFDLGAGSSLQGGTLSSITIALDPTYAAFVPANPWYLIVNCFTQTTYIAANHCTNWATTTNYYISAQATSTLDSKHWSAYFTPITFNPSYFYQFMIDDNANPLPAFGSQALSKPYFILNGVTQ